MEPTCTVVAPSKRHDDLAGDDAVMWACPLAGDVDLIQPHQNGQSDEGPNVRSDERWHDPVRHPLPEVCIALLDGAGNSIRLAIEADDAARLQGGGLQRDVEPPFDVRGLVWFSRRCLYAKTI